MLLRLFRVLGCEVRPPGYPGCLALRITRFAFSSYFSCSWSYCPGKAALAGWGSKVVHQSPLSPPLLPLRPHGVPRDPSRSLLLPFLPLLLPSHQSQLSTLVSPPPQPLPLLSALAPPSSLLPLPLLPPLLLSPLQPLTRPCLVTSTLGGCQLLGSSLFLPMSMLHCLKPSVLPLPPPPPPRLVCCL